MSHSCFFFHFLHHSTNYLNTIYFTKRFVLQFLQRVETENLACYWIPGKTYWSLARSRFCMINRSFLIYNEFSVSGNSFTEREESYVQAKTEPAQNTGNGSVCMHPVGRSSGFRSNRRCSRATDGVWNLSRSPFRGIRRRRLYHSKWYQCRIWKRNWWSYPRPSGGSIRSERTCCHSFRFRCDRDHQYSGRHWGLRRICWCVCGRALSDCNRKPFWQNRFLFAGQRQQRDYCGRQRYGRQFLWPDHSVSYCQAAWKLQ